MLNNRTGDATLTSWITAASTTGLPGLSTFAQHLTGDLDAVTAGLTLQWNSGPVEGPRRQPHHSVESEFVDS
jgi:transposase